MTVERNIRVAELFAGVGGFRVGFEAANKAKKLKDLGVQFKVVWSNQWEPGERAQHASRVYVERFGPENHSNEDIATIDDPRSVPQFDVLVGGFPCQDYSVAKPRNQSAGLEGKKGVLWWEIRRFVEACQPWMAILENVDRLLVSPNGQRGRDFAVMIATLNDLGYAVEWRVINAADYGFAQRRRRVFIVAHKKGTPGYLRAITSANEAIQETGLLAEAFPVMPDRSPAAWFKIEGEPWDISRLFNLGKGQSPFLNAGVAVNRLVVTRRVEPRHSGKKLTLANVLEDDSKVSEEYFIKQSDLPRWREHKGAKRIMRTKKNGVNYLFAEGAIAFPDPLDRPSRTIITSEGGATPSRFKHVIRTKSGRFRRLTPIELEKLSGFPKNHTKVDGIRDARRAFFIGNALVTGLVTSIASAAAREGFFEGLLKEPRVTASSGRRVPQRRADTSSVGRTTARR